MSRDPAAVDPPVGAGLRFLVELVAWMVAPWSVTQWSVPWAAVTLVVLVALPTMLNVPGDKHHTAIAVHGSVRIAVEVLLMAAAVAGAGLQLSAPGVTLTALLVAGAVACGAPRWKWMLRYTATQRLSLSATWM